MTTKLATILADFTTNLATAIIVGGTTATLQSATDDDGVALPAGNYFFAIDGENSSKEHFLCTLSGVNLTAMKSISRQGVQTSGAARAHRIGATVSLTDFAHILYMNNLLKGTDLFDASTPLSYDGTASITLPNQFATKAYADSLAIAGAPNASTSVQGLVQEATQAQADAKTVTGGTGAKLFVPLDKIRSTQLSDYVASDTGSANAYAIAPTPAITAYAAGQCFTFKVANVNTGISTLAVSGLAVKTIKKSGSLDLAAGDLAVGLIVQLMYDGTNFQVLSPIGSPIPVGSVSPYAGQVAPSGFLLCDGTAVSRTTYATLLAVLSPAQTFTVTIASPGVFSATAHGLQIGDKIRLTTTGALPTGLVAATDYFVISAGFTANAFQVSTTRGGSVVNTSGSQSGTHTMRFSNYGVGDGSTTFNVPDLRGMTIYGQKTSDTNFDNLNVPTVYPGEKTHVLVTAELAAHSHTITANTGGGGTTGIGPAGQINTPAVLGSTNNAGSDTAHNNMPPYSVLNYIIKT